MAFTVNRTISVFGNLRTEVMQVTADAATQTIQTRCANLVGFSYGPSSMNSSNIHIAINSNASGVQSLGVIAVTGCTSGDLFYLTVYGN